MLPINNNNNNSEKIINNVLSFYRMLPTEGYTKRMYVCVQQTRH